MLLWSVVLGLVQLVIASMAMNKDVGLPYNLSSRDVPPASHRRQDSGAAGTGFRQFPRDIRVLRGGGTAGGGAEPGRPYLDAGRAALFLGAAGYVPIYALGIIVVRTIVWAVSIVGLVMVLLAAFGAA